MHNKKRRWTPSSAAAGYGEGQRICFNCRQLEIYHHEGKGCYPIIIKGGIRYHYDCKKFIPILTAAERQDRRNRTIHKGGRDCGHVDRSTSQEEVRPDNVKTCVQKTDSGLASQFDIADDNFELTLE